ncbi:N-acetylneuraminate synthase family protein [Gammaproteobacteria bacterium]|nr:N-acetylneuraminate synthase family protein [Gammaproteobacteria bacterium]
MIKKYPVIEIAGRSIGEWYPTYFIADIAANHDGELERAKELIFEAAEAGADAAKFQHYQANTIVSDYGFRELGGQLSHQAAWGQSVYNVYDAAAIDLSWTAELVSACEAAGITFFTSPYSKELVDLVDESVPAYKIGSGDITWLDIIEHIAGKGKPYILATGAATMAEVNQAVRAGLSHNSQLALLQCNTNYTGDIDNFGYLQLRVLENFKKKFPQAVLGLSDHTPGHSAVLGSVALGARIIEKHFTDDNSRVGPDHAFSMTPSTWREMVDRTRELELALGTEEKKIEGNEIETVVLQRRAICLAIDLNAGDEVEEKHLSMLRPCPEGAFPPYQKADVIGRSLKKNMKAGAVIRTIDLD